MTKSPLIWSDLMTAVNQITFILLLICALAGPAQEYAKGEKVFQLSQYIIEVATSAIAGVIVYLLLRVSDLPDEWVGAFTGIGAFFGTKIMGIMYRLLISRLGLIANHKEEGGDK